MWTAWKLRNIEKQQMQKEVELEIVEVLKEVDTAEYEGYKALRVDLYRVSDTKKRYLFKRLRQLGFGIIHQYGYKYLISW